MLIFLQCGSGPYLFHHIFLLTGWTVFQRRVDNSTNFFKNWSYYKSGFGDLTKNFWLGNDKLHQLTHMPNRTQKLRIDLQDNNGTKRYAEYSKFFIGNEAQNYKLTVGTYSGQ